MMFISNQKMLQKIQQYRAKKKRSIYKWLLINPTTKKAHDTL